MNKIKNLLKGSPIATVVAGLVIAGIASAALLTYYGVITGTAAVTQSVLVDGNDYSTPIAGEWDGDTTAGNTIIGSHTIENTGGSPATIGFNTACKKGTWTDGSSPSTDKYIDWADACDGIITRYVEYFDDAGATGYVAPTDCDVTVGSTDGLQTAITNATAGQTVCVEPGTYNENVVISKDITLASTEGPDTTIIDAGNSGNGIMVNGGTGTVTIEGFTIENYGGASGAEGILVNGGSNVVVKYNIIQASITPNPTYSIDSIYTKDGATVTVDHNTLKNNRFGPNAYRSSINDWSTSAGIAVHEGDTVTATNNLFDKNDFGIQVKSDGADSEVVIANYNNFWNTNAVDFFYEKKSGSSATPFDATKNWWGTDGIDIAAGDPTGFIDVDSYINAGWMTKADMELTGGETDQFGIINVFKAALVPDTYTIVTNVAPAK